MKNGILIAIAVFGVSVIGAAIAAAAYFKHKQSMIFDEYEDELAGDFDYYKAPVEKANKDTKTDDAEVCCCGCDEDEEDEDADTSDEIDFADDEETAEADKK